MRGYLALFFLISGLAAPVWAEPKFGPEFGIPADLLGVSGSTAASAGGYAVNATIGLLGSGAVLESPTGSEVWPGLWGGGPAEFGADEGLTFAFGNPRRWAILIIPSGALPTTYSVLTSSNPVNNPLSVAPTSIQTANNKLASAVAGYTRPVQGDIWEIMVKAPVEPYKTKLRKAATLILPYEDANHDGIVDGTNPPVRENMLSIWWLDEVHGLWVKLPGAAVNKANKTVSAPVWKFSAFAAMGAPSFFTGDAYAFPVPWRPNGTNAGPGAGQTGTAAGGITFTNLPSIGKIRVYTLSGTLVREINHTDGTAQEAWDVKNDAGEDVATGTYLFVVESNDSRKNGKLVVVR